MSQPLLGRKDDSGLAQLQLMRGRELRQPTGLARIKSAGPALGTPNRDDDILDPRDYGLDMAEEQRKLAAEERLRKARAQEDGKFINAVNAALAARVRSATYTRASDILQAVQRASKK